VKKASKYLYEIELGGGATIYESRGEYLTGAEVSAPLYPEIESPDDLRNPARIARRVTEIDWSFTADDTAFLTHDLHPYPAKFIPQIPGHLIGLLSLPGELICDPFGGSGTTALEAVRLGRRALSADANPIATLIGRVKTCNLDRGAAMDLHGIRCAIFARIAELSHDPTRLLEEQQRWIPPIPNMDKWFPLSSRGELALLRSRIETMESPKAKDIACLALSRIVLGVSFQDSETRYSSRPRKIAVGDTLKRFLAALDDIIRNVTRTQPVLRYGVCQFVTADARTLPVKACGDNSVDLIVTSPPYGNANDYHLYHRFRLLWLGHDPGALAKVEIGSHLRHQKEATGFDAYLSEMTDAMRTMFRVLKPGRYAVLVVGDAVYGGFLHKGAEAVEKVAVRIGFDSVCSVERHIHATKRSFVAAGRRATTENLLVLRKPCGREKVWLAGPPYRLWPYEAILQKREIERFLGVRLNGGKARSFCVEVDPYTAANGRKLVFTHGIGSNIAALQPTWQATVENGFASQPSARKDPKYVTHGLHAYKGKFYPQLAKALINLSAMGGSGRVLDPFCGSGTTLLEGYLNGYRTFGCDVHPLAARIARAKVGILDVNPDVLRETVGTLLRKIEQAPDRCSLDKEQFVPDCIEEIERWFPPPVVAKLNWLLRAIRAVSDGILLDFLEVVLSGIIRDVSQQDPDDLRIRKRKKPIQDADVFGLFVEVLETQYERIERFWSVRGYSPNRFLPGRVAEGDARDWAVFADMGIEEGMIDLVLTSPPYATALPYIDTDRLSLLVLCGLASSRRRPVEAKMVGSREIITSERKRFETMLFSSMPAELPPSVLDYLRGLHARVANADVGFRRQNMPALLLRFFLDMAAVLANCRRALRSGGEAMIVVGDNRTQVDGEFERIPTTDFLADIAGSLGLLPAEHIDISVTTENLVHIKNAITKNVVLRFRKP
jgi:DNA modification methylase